MNVLIRNWRCMCALAAFHAELWRPAVGRPMAAMVVGASDAHKHEMRPGNINRRHMIDRCSL